MDDRFYNSFFPPQTKVCGRKLSTFSLWHHLILTAIDSPIAVGGDKISVIDLLVAVNVCRLEYGDTNFKHGFKDIIWRKKLFKNPDLFNKEAQRFYKWMEKQTSPPKFYIKDKGGGKTTEKGVQSAPRCLGLVCSLMSRGGVSERDAWSMNLGKAMWMDAQLAQFDGVNLKFLDDKDLDSKSIDTSFLTDDQAMSMFKKELPERLVNASFEHWRKNIKKSLGGNND